MLFYQQIIGGTYSNAVVCVLETFCWVANTQCKPMLYGNRWTSRWTIQHKLGMMAIWLYNLEHEFNKNEKRKFKSRLLFFVFGHIFYFTFFWISLPHDGLIQFSAHNTAVFKLRNNITSSSSNITTTTTIVCQSKKKN